MHLKKNNAIQILFVCLTLIFSLDLWSQSSSTTYLVVNNPKVRKFDFEVGNVTIGNQKIVDFKADRNKNWITLFPKNPGTTLLFVFDQKGNQKEALELVVYSQDPDRLLDQVRQLLVDIEGITIKKLNDKIIIDGEVILPQDKVRIQKVMSSTPNIVDLSRMSTDTKRTLAKKIESEIGLDEVRVRTVKDQIVLEGEVYSKQAYQKAEFIAKLYDPNVLNGIDIREVPRAPVRQPTVEITAHFVEVAKNFSKNFNFKWSPVPRVGTSLSYSINPVSGSENFTGSVSGTASDLLPRLNYFKSLGVAQILENPSVSVKSGETATIESGSRIGFPVAQGNGTVSIEFQDIGAKLKIIPFVRGTDVDMNIEVKISSLGAPTLNGSVNIDQSSVSTSQIVRSGESVVLGGLVRHSFRQFLDRPPQGGGGGGSATASSDGGSSGTLVDPFPLGSLFTLFKSNDQSRQRSQFLVFITPRILQQAKDAHQDLKDQFNLYEVYPDGSDPTSTNKKE